MPRNHRQAKASRLNRFYWMSYAAPPSVLTRGRRTGDFKSALHMTRDGAAFAEIHAVLSCRYQYGGVLLNLPRDCFSVTSHSPGPTLSNSDLIVMTTRPPLDDVQGEDRRAISRSRTPVEHDVSLRLRAYFSVCSRQHIILAPGIAQACPMRAIEFRTRNQGSAREATVRRFGSNVNEKTEFEKSDICNTNQTAGYIVFLPAIKKPHEAPAVLCIFGMGGVETLTWTHCLAMRHSEIIWSLLDEERPGLLIGLFERTVPSEQIPTDLSFVDGWPDPEWVLDTRSAQSRSGPASAPLVQLLSGSTRSRAIRRRTS